MKLLAFTYLSLINSFLLLAMGDILLASPKFCISLIYYGELFTTLSMVVSEVLRTFVSDGLLFLR